MPQIDYMKAAGPDTGVTVPVDSAGRLLVRKLTDFQVALLAGDAYSWHASADIGITDQLLSVQNLSKTRRLHIKKVYITNDNAGTASTFHLELSGVTTPTGTAVTGKQLNTGSSNVADALAIEDDTAGGNDTNQENIITAVSVFDESSAEIEMPDGSDLCILAANQVVTLHMAGELDLASCEFIGYFKDAA